MNPPNITGRDAGALLRQRAEDAYRSNGSAEETAEEIAASPEAARRMLHELRVHQIELELQAEELRRSQAELEASHARYFELYDLAPNGYCTLSSKGLVKQTNLTLAAQLGRPRAALVHSAFSQLLHHEDVKAYYSLHAELLRSGRPQRCEWRMVRADETVFWVHVTAIVAEEAGAPVLQLALSDITQLKETEARVRERESRHAALTGAAREAIITADVQGRITEWNRAASEKFGYTEAEAIGAPLTMLIPDRFRDAHEAGMARLLTGDGRRTTSRDAELAGLGKGGREFPIEHSLFEWEVPSGRFVTAIIRDVSERKAVEEQVRKFSHIIETAPMSIIITDLAGKIEYVNPRFTSVSGYTPQEAIGQTPRLIKSALTPAETHREIWRTITAGGVWNGELMNRKKNGETYLENVLISPVRDEQGRPTHYIAMKDDLTARKRFEADSANKLEQQRHLLEMKSRFISVTSHEFRTPMAAVMGSVEILNYHLEQLAPEKRSELLARITSSMQRMSLMLDEILMLNRIDANRVDVKLAPLDLRGFLPDLLAEMRLADRGGHLIELVGGETAATITSDLNLLRTVLSNLLTNALRYSPAGSTVTLRVKRDDQHAVIAVEDQGIGVPTADRGRIFEPFERGSNVGVVVGSGLGLSIVKRLTELLGGAVTLDDRAGAGSRFVLVLPLQPGRNPAPK